MNKKTFPKGVHPPDKKEISKDFKIETFPPGKLVIVPLHQHIGAPSEPLVKRKDKILKGQKIGEAKGFVSASVHSPVSGEVKKVEPRLSPLGYKILSVEIENDGEEKLAEEVKPLKDDISAYSPEEVRTTVREAGIVGLGGASFPTSVKITPPKEHPIDTLILNGVECEPYLTADYRLMLEKPEELIQGADILKETVGASKIHIGIEDNKEDVIELYEKKLRGRSDFVVSPLKTKYPQGGEKMLIKAILNREVPNAGGLPFQVGVLVQNVGTVYAIYSALKNGMPLIERIVSVTGDGIRNPKNLAVRIGTLFKDIIENSGGYKDKIGKLIMGGPMMGLAQWSEDIPVMKATSGILALSKANLPKRKEYTCIRCNKCVDHCPMNLVPTRLATLVENKRLEDAEEWGLMDCIECGTCDYGCPANIPLVHWIKLGKSELLKKRKKTEK